jgi:hypothetical protein
MEWSTDEGVRSFFGTLGYLCTILCLLACRLALSDLLSGARPNVAKIGPN